MISHQQQVVLSALDKSVLSVADLRARHLAPQTAGSLVRRGYVARILLVGYDTTEIGYRITDQGKHVLTRALARMGGVQGATEYEPHPYEAGDQTDELGRGKCAICGRLGAQSVHHQLNDEGTWS